MILFWYFEKFWNLITDIQNWWYHFLISKMHLLGMFASKRDFNPLFLIIVYNVITSSDNEIWIKDWYWQELRFPKNYPWKKSKNQKKGTGGGVGGGEEEGYSVIKLNRRALYTYFLSLRGAYYTLVLYMYQQNK